MELQHIFDQSVAQLKAHDLFYGHGVADAEDEVILLLMHVMQVDFESLNQMQQALVTDEQQQQIARLLAERVSSRKPMAYLIGMSVFAGLIFRVDERVLIPRSPFVSLIDEGFAPWVDMSSVSRVLDMCTGSGCIGLAVAHYFPDTQVDLVDLSEPALDLARLNQDRLQLTDRTRCIHSDLFDSLEEERYDLIIANPPYVDEDEYRTLPDEYRHEPEMALVSDWQGMQLPVRILAAAAGYLSESGCLFLEVGYNDDVLNRCLPDVPITWVDLTAGGHGICVFSRRDLLKYQPQFSAFLKAHVT